MCVCDPRVCVRVRARARACFVVNITHSTGKLHRVAGVCAVRCRAEYVSRDSGRGSLQWEQGVPHPDTASRQAKVKAKRLWVVGMK